MLWANANWSRYTRVFCPSLYLCRHSMYLCRHSMYLCRHSMYLCRHSMYLCRHSMYLCRHSTRIVLQRSIVGDGICVRASTVDAGFPRKAQRPAPRLSCRSRESTLRISQLETLHVGLLSFLVPVPSLYVPVPSLGGSRRPRWSSASLALTNFSRVEWASDIRWSRRFAPVPGG